MSFGKENQGEVQQYAFWKGSVKALLLVIFTHGNKLALTKFANAILYKESGQAQQVEKRTEATNISQQLKFVFWLIKENKA